MNQYKQIFAWKCIKCGRVLTTPQGAEWHLQKCKYIIPVLPGQVTMDDVLEEEEGRRSLNRATTLSVETGSALKMESQT